MDEPPGVAEAGMSGGTPLAGLHCGSPSFPSDPGLSEVETDRRNRVGPAAIRVARDPVVTILLLAGIFDGLSGNPVHAVLLIGVAVALAADAVVRFGGDGAEASLGGPFVKAGKLRTAVLLAIAAIYAVLIGRLPRYSWPMTVAVIVPGTVVLALAWLGRIGRRPETTKL